MNQGLHFLPSIAVGFSQLFRIDAIQWASAPFISFASQLKLTVINFPSPTLDSHFYLNPLPCIGKGFDPRGHLMVGPAARIVWPLPGEYRIFEMGHDGEVPAVMRSDARRIEL